MSRRGPDPARVGHRVISLAAAGVLVVLISGCGAPPDPVSANDNAAPSGHRAGMEPTGAPSPALTPGPDQRASRAVAGKGFRIAAGSAFEQLDKKSSNGEPMLVLRRPSSHSEVPSIVSILRQPKPQQGVVEETYALELAQRTAQGSTDVTRSIVTWPQARTSVLVQWTQRMTGAEGAFNVRYWQLNSEVNDDLTLVVVGLSPVEDFASSGIAETMSSFRISP